MLMLLKILFYNYYQTIHSVGPARIDRTRKLPTPDNNEVVQGAGRTNEPVYGRDNNKISLHCFYSGLGQPITQWFFVLPSGMQVPVNSSDPVINITDNSMNLILTIFPFSERYAGTYRCNTSNDAGSDTGDVIVQCKVWFALCVIVVETAIASCLKNGHLLTYYCLKFQITIKAINYLPSIYSCL